MWESGEKTVASSEDSQYLFKFARSPFTNRFGLITFSKLLNAEAEIVIADAMILEEQEKSQRDADLKKKEADDMEAVRQKNQRRFAGSVHSLSIGIPLGLQVFVIRKGLRHRERSGQRVPQARGKGELK